jgi:signal transduction histidine kinase
MTDRRLDTLSRLRATSRAAARLSSRLDLDFVLETVVDTLISDFDGVLTRVWIHDPDTATLTLKAEAGSPNRYSRGRIVAVDDRERRVAKVARSRKPLIQNDLSRDPAIDFEWRKREQVAALAGFPLQFGNELLGVMMHFSREPLTDETIELLATFAALLTTSLNDVALFEREQSARAAAEVSESRYRFVAEASRVLSGSLNYHVTLDRAAHLAVPTMADWCLVHLVQNDHGLALVSLAGEDATATTGLRQLLERFPLKPTALHGPANVTRTGESEMALVRDEWLVAAAEAPEHLAAMRALDLTSYMCVPLPGRGRTLGAISFISAGSRRVYGPGDLLLAEDIARRMATAIENALLYTHVQEASRSKDEFLATVSHELRTPLTSVLGWSRLLRTGALDQRMTARAVEAIERNARLQAQLIGDLLDVSRIISGKMRVDLRSLDPLAVAESALDVVRPTAEAKGVAISRHVSETGPILGDPDRLQQVLWNLLSNAIKFTPPGGRVELRIEPAEPGVRIVVSDSGRGVRPEFLPHIFERFRQQDSTSTRAHGGLGLGLAIVRHLVELHGGSVHATSDGEDRGATFTIVLPQAKMDGPPAVPHRGARPGELAGVRALVVEDEPDTREMVCVVLERAGAEVRSAGSAREADSVLEHWQPGVIVADIAMPDEDGYMFIERIRRRAPERGGAVPALALTAYVRGEDRQRAFLAGFQAHMSKPLDPLELIETVARLTEAAAPQEFSV